MSLRIRTEHAATTSPVDTLDGSALLLLLHGRGSNERDLLPLAEAFDDVVVALRAPLSVDDGFAWADGTRTEILAGTGLAPAADAVLAWLDGLPAAGLGRPARVRLLGFSQGGAVALTMARRAPARFDRIVVLSGFVPDEAEAGDAALAEDPPAVFWGRGEDDPVIPAEAIARTAVWLRRHARATVSVEPGLGHGVSPAEVAEVAAFLA